MRELDIGQNDLSSMLGNKSPTSISQYFTGKRTPGLDIITTWADALGTTPAWLLTDHSASPSVVLPKPVEALLSRVNSEEQWRKIEGLLRILLEASPAESDESDSATG